MRIEFKEEKPLRAICGNVDCRRSLIGIQSGFVSFGSKGISHKIRMCQNCLDLLKGAVEQPDSGWDKVGEHE